MDWGVFGSVLQSTRTVMGISMTEPGRGVGVGDGDGDGVPVGRGVGVRDDGVGVTLPRRQIPTFGLNDEVRTQVYPLQQNDIMAQGSPSPRQNWAALDVPRTATADTPRKPSTAAT